MIVIILYNVENLVALHKLVKKLARLKGFELFLCGVLARILSTSLGVH